MPKKTKKKDVENTQEYKDVVQENPLADQKAVLQDTLTLLYRPPRYPDNSCPNCGACPHCGRGGYVPYVPYTPWYGDNVWVGDAPINWTY